MHIYVCVYVYGCLCACVSECVSRYVSACICVFVCVSLCVSLCVCLHEKSSQLQSARGCPSWIKLGFRGEGSVTDNSGAGRPGMPQDGCPEELGLKLETFKLDESTNSAICQPTVFLFLTPEKYSLPSLLQHSWLGVGDRIIMARVKGTLRGRVWGE